MRFLKRIAAIVLILDILLSLTACESKQERAYNAAAALLDRGDYARAAEQFEALGSYEDTSQMALYAKAYNAAESGNYEAAIAAFTSLGSFKDCKLLVPYYDARNCEDQGEYDAAIELYNQNPLIKDSSERIANIETSIKLQHIYFKSVRSTGDPERWLVYGNGAFYILNIANKTLNYFGDWDVVYDFCEGFAIVKKNDKYGFINESGEVVIPLELGYAADFYDGLAYVEKDGRYCYINTSGERVDNSFAVCDGYMVVIEDGRLTVTDPDGNIVF